MNDISIVGLFCDSVREEKGQTETIVGVFPDNVNVSEVPIMFARMGVYVRCHIRPTFDPGPITMRIVMPDGSALDKGEVPRSVVEQSRQKARDANAPYAGVIARFMVSPMHIPAAGRLQLVVTVDGEDHVAAALNIIVVQKTT